ITFDLNCGASADNQGTAGAGLTGVTRIVLTTDYVIQDLYDPFSGPQANARCVKTAQGSMNVFQIRLSTSHVEVWGSDAGTTDLRQLAEADFNLSWSRGYVNLSHVHYNAEKTGPGVTTFQSYQWAKVAFDGPVLPTPRAYEIADPLSLVHTSIADAYHIAYQVTDGSTFDIDDGPTLPRTLIFSSVDPSGGVSARVNFDTSYVAAGDVLQVRLNGNDWHSLTVPMINTTWERQGFSIPVPVADLVAGDNTIEFQTTSNPGFSVPANSMDVANIDLEVEVQ
ncbi:MAG TPA: hypothetical protein VGI10_00415, partial [Polyangiaceae bacterium]